MQFRRKSSGRGLKNWYVQEMDKEFPEILPWPRKKSKPHPKPRLSHHGEDPFPPGYGSRQWLLERGMDLDQNTEPSQLKEILTGRSRKPERG